MILSPLVVAFVWKQAKKSKYPEFINGIAAIGALFSE
jgi:hypothetical protein